MDRTADLGRPGVFRIGTLQPEVDASVYIAPGAVIVGDVAIGADSGIWFNAVLRGDAAPVRVGRRTNVQDLALLHVDPGFPCVVGDDVTIGHGAIIHGCTIEDGVTVGMGAVILTGATIREQAVVAAGALVTEGMDVPAGMLAMGSPAKVRREVTAEERLRFSNGTAHYVENARSFAHANEPIEGNPDGS